VFVCAEENGEVVAATKPASAAVDNMETLAQSGTSEVPSSSEHQSQKEEPASSSLPAPVPAPAPPTAPKYRCGDCCFHL
jgi:hypothetical protein